MGKAADGVKTARRAGFFGIDGRRSACAEAKAADSGGGRKANESRQGRPYAEFCTGCNSRQTCHYRRDITRYHSQRGNRSPLPAAVRGAGLLLPVSFLSRAMLTGRTCGLYQKIEVADMDKLRDTWTNHGQKERQPCFHDCQNPCISCVEHTGLEPVTS